MPILSSWPVAVTLAALGYMSGSTSTMTGGSAPPAPARSFAGSLLGPEVADRRVRDPRAAPLNAGLSMSYASEPLAPWLDSPADPGALPALPLGVASTLQYDSRSQHPDSPTRRGPAVPEPLFFDLVRPLGAAVGEVEVNTLAGVDRDHVGWAPEIEAVILRNLAVELELPFQDDQVESYKSAVQYTIGTGWDERMIHGVQGIYEHQRQSNVNELSLLHITATRFDPTWSALWMVGGRGHLGGEYEDARADLLLNASLFADLAEHVVAGVETNLAQPLGDGRTSFKLIPQLHLGFSESLHLQVGFGLVQEGSDSSGLATARVIWAF